MIEIGENPENTKGINKFIAKSGDGQRGKIIAMHKNKKEAIILAMNSSCKGDVKWGHFYHVEEKQDGNYPVVVKEVHFVDAENWSMV